MPNMFPLGSPGLGIGSIISQALAGASGPLGAANMGDITPTDREMIRQTLAAGQPVTSIERSGLGGLLSKIGLLSPNIAPTAHQQALDKLALMAQSQQRAGDIANIMGSTAQMMEVSPDIAEQAYGQERSLVPGLTAIPHSVFSGYKTKVAIAAEAEQHRADYEFETERLKARQLDIEDKRAQNQFLIGQAHNDIEFAQLQQTGQRLQNQADQINNQLKESEQKYRLTLGTNQMRIAIAGGDPNQIKAAQEYLNALAAEVGAPQINLDPANPEASVETWTGMLSRYLTGGPTPPPAPKAGLRPSAPARPGPGASSFAPLAPPGTPVPGALPGGGVGAAPTPTFNPKDW